MTLAPIDAMYLVKGIDGPRYKVAARCANPDCRRFSAHVHHIFRRSAIGGDYAWVLVDGVPVGNLTGLCVQCHNEVDGGLGGHSAAIRYDRKTKIFHWAWVRFQHDDPEYVLVAPLNPQPPTPETLSEPASQEKTESEHCPFCGQTKRRRSAARVGPGPPRRRKSWNVSVPADSEDGAEILDAFVDDVAIMLGAGEWDERNRRYWALVHALAWLMQHREQFSLDVRQAA